MRYFAVLIEVKDFESAKTTLIDFKTKMKEQGDTTVIELEQSNYDFLYNSLIEKSNSEKKRRS